MTSGLALGSPMNRVANIFVLVLGRIEDRAARFGERKLYRICWQTIFIPGKPQWSGKPLTQLRFMSRQADIRRFIGASSVYFRSIEGEPSGTLKKRDKSQFLSALDTAVQAALREAARR
jgi:hypothetical protein